MFDGNTIDLLLNEPFSNPIPLPVPPLSTESLTYLGNTPSVHQKAMYSHDGELRLFVQDGIIYNGTGHAIAVPSDYFINGEYQSMDDYSQSGQEFVRYTERSNGLDIQITRVPLTHDLYYVIFSEKYDGENDDIDIRIFAIIVDMSIDNPYFSDPSILGGLVTADNVSAYPQFAQVEFDTDYNSRILIQELENYGTSDAVNFAFMETLDMGEIAGRKLFISHADQLYIHNFGNSGALLASSYLIEYCDQAITRSTINSQSTLLTQAGGQMRVAYLDSEGSYILAFSTGIDWFAGGAGESIPTEKVIVVSLNCHATQVTSSICVQGPGGIVRGLEFSSDGRYLFVNSDNDPGFDGNTFIAYDLTAGGYIPDSEVDTYIADHAEFKKSRLYRGIYNNSEVIYIQGDNGQIAVIQNIDEPSSMDISIIPSSASLQSCSFEAANSDEYASISNGISRLRFFSTAYNDGRTILAEELTEECCQSLAQFEGLRGDIPFYNVELIDEDSPFFTSEYPNLVYGTLHFYPGADVTIKETTFEFGTLGKVQIETGARVTLDSSTLTSAQCIELMWQGVKVQGNGNAVQEDYFGPNQGRLTMQNNSVIENAWSAVTVSSGGVVTASKSKFRNNAVSVSFSPYPFSPLFIGVNKSQFKDVTFITDDILNVSYIPPSTHVSLQGMNKVNFGFCSFLNTTPYNLMSTNKRGMGINSINSSFQLYGNNAPYTGQVGGAHDSFYRLTTGIRAVNNTVGTFSVYKMEFQDCRSGIQAAGMQGEVIAYNNFSVPQFTITPGELSRPPEAIYLLGSTGYSVEENHITGPGTPNSYGIIVDSSGDEENEIYRNTISNISAGIYNKKINGSLAATVQTGLQVRCHIFEENNADMYVSEHSWWRLRQGDSDPILFTGLTNNKFSANVCDQGYADVLVNDAYGNFEPYFSTDASFDYLFQTFESTTPHCESDHMLPVGIENLNDAVFMYEQSCPVQFTVQELNVDPFTEAADIIPVLIFLGSDERNDATLLAERELEVQLLRDAHEAYVLTVDAGDKADLLAAIQESMTVSSAELKMLLFAKSPLSEEVLKQTIGRSPAMNSWHLTQVMIANSPLRKEVINCLVNADVLSPFFMNFVMNAQENAALSFKLLLEYEMSSHEKTIANLDKLLMDREQHTAGWWEESYTGADESEVLSKLSLSKGVASKEYLISHALLSGDTQTAQDLLAEVTEESPRKEWLHYLVEHPGVLSHPDEMELQDLMDRYVADGLDYDRAFITLAVNGELKDEWPTVTVPSRSMSQSLHLNGSKYYTEEILLAINPNPASELAFITYPAEADGIADVQIHDMLGRLIFNSPLNTLGIMELDVKDWPRGLYIATLIHEGKVLQATKFNVTD